MESDTMKWQKTMMCTQDIFLHNNNVTQSINADEIKEFQGFCAESATFLCGFGKLILNQQPEVFNFFYNYLFQHYVYRKIKSNPKSANTTTIIPWSGHDK